MKRLFGTKPTAETEDTITPLTRVGRRVERRNPLVNRSVSVSGTCSTHGHLSMTVTRPIARGDSYTVTVDVVCTSGIHGCGIAATLTGQHSW
jgi:hypothetical protein